MLFKKPTTAALEADLAGLEKRKTSLEARLAGASASVLSAVGARRHLLVESDEPEAKALASADRACREAQDAEAAAEDALAEVKSRIAGARDRLVRLKAAEGREREAAALDAVATKADAAIARIVKATAEIAAARTELAASIPSDAVPLYAPPSNAVSYGPSYLTTALFYDFEGKAVGETLTPEQIAIRIVGHMLAPALPGLGIAKIEDTLERHANGQPTRTLAPVEDPSAAKGLLSDPLRARAAALRTSLTPATAA